MLVITYRREYVSLEGQGNGIHTVDVYFNNIAETKSDTLFKFKKCRKSYASILRIIFCQTPR